MEPKLIKRKFLHRIGPKLIRSTGPVTVVQNGPKWRKVDENVSKNIDLSWTKMEQKLVLVQQMVQQLWSKIKKIGRKCVQIKVHFDSKQGC